jgi:hypothetical protein
LGKYGVDLRGDPFSGDQYHDLLNTLHGTRPKAPAIVPRRSQSSSSEPQTTTSEPAQFEPVRILNIIVDEVTTPRNDGTRGSALYRIPFQLSRRPPSEWCDVFIEQWNHPPRFTSMHRPGIATVSGDKVYLDGTTIEEVKKYHRETLVLALNETNRLYADYAREKFAREQQRCRLKEDHERKVREDADDIRFD